MPNFFWGAQPAKDGFGAPRCKLRPPAPIAVEVTTELRQVVRAIADVAVG